jgi:uncharacterized coiled-coil DUF342 family protein
VNTERLSQISQERGPYPSKEEARHLAQEVERLREERDRLTEALREVTNRLRLLTNDHAGVAIGESALAGVSE